MTTKTFLPGNWTDYIPVITFIFICGIIYNSLNTLITNVESLRQEEKENNEYVISKLEKKIKIINEHDKRIKSLEEYRAYEDGYNAAKKEFKIKE